MYDVPSCRGEKRNYSTLHTDRACLPAAHMHTGDGGGGRRRTARTGAGWSGAERRGEEIAALRCEWLHSIAWRTAWTAERQQLAHRPLLITTGLREEWPCGCGCYAEYYQMRALHECVAVIYGGQICTACISNC